MPALKVLRPVSILETVSWILLIVATVVKYTQGSQLAVHILGPIHGVLFLTYVGSAIVVHQEVHWPRPTLIKVLVASIVPGGGFWVHDKVLARLNP